MTTTNETLSFLPALTDDQRAMLQRFSDFDDKHGNCNLPVEFTDDPGNLQYSLAGGEMKYLRLHLNSMSQHQGYSISSLGRFLLGQSVGLLVTLTERVTVNGYKKDGEWTQTSKDHWYDVRLAETGALLGEVDAKAVNGENTSHRRRDITNRTHSEANQADRSRYCSCALPGMTATASFFVSKGDDKPEAGANYDWTGFTVALLMVPHRYGSRLGKKK